ncbi:MAG: adenylate kinase [Clostridiaceae bacterium]|jgi:adenylate kinase|nr:adenylate kinase [Eubacteriales bacterium]NLV48518.1 adenylate kinase [Clostridiaceae bacterium]
MQLILLGPPGSGKGTLASDLEQRYQIPHISTGDIFRRAVREKTRLGLEVEAIISQGELVPDTLTIALVEDRLSQSDCLNGYLLDGFPRTLPQAEALSEMPVVQNKPLTAVINLVVRESVIVERLSNRRVCSKCGRTYNVVSLKPQIEGVCDACGHPVIQRKDDQTATILHRLEAYHQATEPLVGYYRDQNLLIDFDNEKSIQDTAQAVYEYLEQIRPQAEADHG